MGVWEEAPSLLHPAFRGACEDACQPPVLGARVTTRWRRGRHLARARS